MEEEIEVTYEIGIKSILGFCFLVRSEFAFALLLVWISVLCFGRGNGPRGRRLASVACRAIAFFHTATSTCILIARAHPPRIAF